MIPQSDWQWFGCAGHLIVSRYCRFHLCTRVGRVLVSTVGEYFPADAVREILADTRGVTLAGRGDAREHDYMKKIGYEDIGYNRKYETMAFKVTEEVCSASDCGCGLPEVEEWTEIAADGYNSAGPATAGHLAMCVRFSEAQP